MQVSLDSSSYFHYSISPTIVTAYQQQSYYDNLKAGNLADRKRQTFSLWFHWYSWSAVQLVLNIPELWSAH